MAGLDAWANRDERHVRAVIVQVLLAEQPVMADGQPVVGAEKDVGVLRLAGGVERVEDAPDLRVHVLDDRVIFLPVHLHCVVRARERPEFLVAQIGTAADGVLVRVLVEIIFRHLDAAQRVAVDVLLRRLPGVVRRVERDVHEERPLVPLGFADVIDRVVRDHLAPMLAALPESVELHVVRAPRVGLAGQRPVVALRCLVRHAAANVTGDLKRLVGGSLDMPFAGEKRLVTGASHDLRPEVGVLRLACGLLCGREVFAFAAQHLRRLLRPPDVPAGDEHVATGHADRATPRAHVVRAGELRAAVHQAVEVWRVDVGQAKRADCLEALVVGEEEQHIRLGLGVCLAKREAECGGCGQAAEALDRLLFHRFMDLLGTRIVGLGQAQSSQ